MGRSVGLAHRDGMLAWLEVNQNFTVNAARAARASSGSQNSRSDRPVGPPSKGKLQVLHYVVPCAELADRMVLRDHQQSAEPPCKRKVAGHEAMVTRCHVVCSRRDKLAADACVPKAHRRLAPQVARRVGDGGGLAPPCPRWQQRSSLEAAQQSRVEGTLVAHADPSAQCEYRGVRTER